MKQTIMCERTATIFALLSGLLGMLLWLLVHLAASLWTPHAAPGLHLLWSGKMAALVAGLAAVSLGAYALRHLEAETLLHRRASEGFVFGVILLALTVGLSLMK
jgi:hypothetical protein